MTPPRTRSTTAPPPGSPPGPRVAAAIEAWKRKLLDLSMRNRLLNFRTTKSSTVTVVDEQPAEVFRQLALLGQSMKFAAASEPAIEEAASDDADESLTPEAPATRARQMSLVDFAPYERENLHQRHRDGILQTNASAERLDCSTWRARGPGIGCW